MKGYWNERYIKGGNSGDGSYGEVLFNKLKLLSNLDIKSISEIGCGDFNFGANLLKLYPNASYVGSDISEYIVKKNRKAHPEHVFLVDKDVPDADLLLCVDVLFHILDDKEYEAMLNRLDHYTNYLAVTAYEEEQRTSPHLKIRKFDYKRFGEPIIREVVQKDGQLYFYLFEKSKIDLSKISCVLLTKDAEYPKQILDEIAKYPFGEVLIGTNSPSPYFKHELFKRAKFDLIYYQDDDCIAPIKQLVEQSKPNMINVAMKPGHIESHKDSRATMGLGWGAIFPKSILSSLQKYTDKYGFDEVYQRETERILTYLNFPQNRLALPIEDLPSAWDENRLWRQPQHNEFKEIAEERCKELI